MLKGIKEKLKWLDPFTYVDIFIMPIVNPRKEEWVSLAVYVLFAFLFAFVLFQALGFFLSTASPMVIVVSSSMEPVLFRGDVVMISGVQAKDIMAPQVTLDRPSLDAFPLSDYAKTFCTQNGSVEQKECSLFPNTCPANYNTTSIEFEGQSSVQVGTSGDIVVYTSNAVARPIQIIHRVVAKINASDGTYLLTKGDNECNSKIDQEVGIARGAINVEGIEGKAIFWVPRLGCVKLWVFDDLPSLLLTGRLPREFSGIC